MWDSKIFFKICIKKLLNKFIYLKIFQQILEEKLAKLDHTFGKKGKVLEEETRDLAEERNSLTEKKRRPLYRKVSITGK